MEQENRVRMKTVQKEHDTKVELLQQRIKNLQKDVAQLNKTNKQQQQLQIKTEKMSNALAAAAVQPAANTTPVPKGRSSDSSGSGSPAF